MRQAVSRTVEERLKNLLNTPNGTPHNLHTPNGASGTPHNTPAGTGTPYSTPAGSTPGGAVNGAFVSNVLYQYMCRVSGGSGEG